MRIPTMGLIFHSWMGPKGPYTAKVSTATLLSYNQNISTVLALSFILFRFFGTLQAQSSGLGHCKRD